MANLASELGEKCTESDLKKSQICPIWGQSDPIWMANLPPWYKVLRLILFSSIIPLFARPSRPVSSSQTHWRHLFLLLFLKPTDLQVTPWLHLNVICPHKLD